MTAARRAVRAGAVAAALVASGYGCAAVASGMAAPPASLPLVGPGTRVLCRAARFDGGSYGAKHCGAGRTVDGQHAAHSDDPTRDLRHFACCAAPGVALRPAVPGEALTWRNDRAGGSVTVHQTDQGGGRFAFVWRDGDMARLGESGTGLYGADGALVGVLVELSVTLTEHAPTGTGWAVQVP